MCQSFQPSIDTASQPSVEIDSVAHGERSGISFQARHANVRSPNAPMLAPAASSAAALLATPWPVEAKLTIGFWLEERNRIWVDGIVISQHQGLGMGIKFLNLSRKNLEDLTRFIELLPQQRTLSPVRADS